MPSSWPFLAVQVLGLPNTWPASLLQRTGTQPPGGRCHPLPPPRALRHPQAAELSLEVALLGQRVCVQPSLGPLGSGCLLSLCARAECQPQARGPAGLAKSGWVSRAIIRPAAPVRPSGTT